MTDTQLQRLIEAMQSAIALTGSQVADAIVTATLHGSVPAHTDLDGSRAASLQETIMRSVFSPPEEELLPAGDDDSNGRPT